MKKMDAMKAHELRGNWAAVLLPIHENGEIDYVRLEEEVEALADAGVDGIYTNGTAGEFYAQSEKEFDLIHTIVAGCCHRRGVPFQIGASHPIPQMSLERIRRSLIYEPCAIQVILPDWFPPNDDEAIDCLRRMAEAAESVPLVLYNPPHAKRVLSPPGYARLKEHVPSLIGLKVMDGDAAWYGEMRRYARELSVFVPGHHLATGISMGARGSYSNVACLHPKAAQAWYRLTQTDLKEALSWEQKIRLFMDRHISPLIRERGYSNQAADKLLAAIGGWGRVGTRLRWPYRGVPEEEARRLRPYALDMLPEAFAENLSPERKNAI